MDFVIDVYSTTKAFPRDETYGLASQLRRTARPNSHQHRRGPGALLAAGVSLLSEPCRGALVEVETQLLIAQKLDYFAPGTRQNSCWTKLPKSAESLNGLIGVDQARRITENRELGTENCYHPPAHASHSSQSSARSDRRGSQCVWRRDHRAEPLGAILSQVFRRAGRGIHAGDRDRGNLPRQPGTGRQERCVPGPGRIPDHSFLRAHGHAPLSLRRGNSQGCSSSTRHKGYSVLLGLIIHTFFDGIAITSGFIVSNWLGWIIFLAIFLHKIPEGFTVTSVMLASGQSRGSPGALPCCWGRDACRCADHGVLRHEVSFGLPLSAGVTIYVAASDLIPEVNREPGAGMALVVFLGVGLFSCSTTRLRPLNAATLRCVSPCSPRARSPDTSRLCLFDLALSRAPHRPMTSTLSLR